MKTVQEYFKEVEEERLIRYYLYKYPVNLDDISNRTLTVNDVKKLLWDRLKRYIERLRTLEIEPSESGDESILFCHKKMEDGFSVDTSALVCMNELLEKKEDAEIYDYMFTKQAEILGFYVAETEMTQDNIISLLTEVMHTASMFGFEQEYMQDEIEKLEKAIEEAECGKTKYFTTDEIREELGLKKEEEDPVEDELRSKAAWATFEYDQYCKKKLRKLLNKIDI